MANENNNINELVADDDPTAELETPTFAMGDSGQLESDAGTYDVAEHKGVRVSELRSSLELRNETISQLQFDIEQLRSKWLGLDAEIKARESQTESLNGELSDLRTALDRKDKLLRERDRKIRSLKTEIRQRDERHRRLIDDFESLEDSIDGDEIAQPDSNSLALQELSVDQLIERIVRSEEYADSMRQQLQDLIESSHQLQTERDNLDSTVRELRIDQQMLQQKIAAGDASIDDLNTQLAQVAERHAEEIRMVRFELGEAQETIVEKEQVNSQLASDLVDARGFKQELEQMLQDNEEKSASEITSLQKEMRKLTVEVESYQQKLNTKSEAITVLLAELAKRSEQIQSIGEIEDVIHDIDDRITERIDDVSRPPGERMTRLLVGAVDGQELRFPLFKDRLTIGRTEDNDIQLNAAYVSRRHAVVQTDRDVTRIIDWGSKNGVYVNETRVKEHFLTDGDDVLIGNARFRYEERPKRD